MNVESGRIKDAVLSPNPDRCQVTRPLCVPKLQNSMAFCGNKRCHSRFLFEEAQTLGHIQLFKFGVLDVGIQPQALKRSNSFKVDILELFGR